MTDTQTLNPSDLTDAGPAGLTVEDLTIRYGGNVAEAIELCGIGDMAGLRAGSLSTGQRRLVELARALAGEFRFLLLDEPSSGLDKAETAVFGSILRRVVEERGSGILLVEHDMDL